MPDVYSFGIEPISCHAWNGDRTQIALSHNDHEAKIYRWNGTKWNLIDTLSEHVQRITGLDWAANSNRIVSCGADRNAYVWTQQDGRWKPTLVILRINRAATCVKWSPLETKFAVGSGARVISVCYFEKENDWWVSKQIKKPIRSTVTCLDWHANNVLLAVGSSDFKARVFSAYIKEVDTKPDSTSWGKKMTFANLMAEFSNGGGGWVHSVGFSGCGDQLAWVGHDSSMSVVDASRDSTISTVRTQFLPFVSCMWISPTVIAVAGHDCCPMVFSFSNGKLTYSGKVDESKGTASKKFSARDHFRSLDNKGTTAEHNVTALGTIHQNTITQMEIHSGNKMSCSKFSTSSVDGQLIVWDTKSLESAIAGLRI